ncbi:MAG: PQQ-binding-like beta-propeller repeat protein [Acidobacteria bacterium]|nr:PQQ-binding-like beta-propeller repeat protein [Acidobacteriota bacterium]
MGDRNCETAVQLARQTELLIYVQLETAEQVDAARRAADREGFYGNRIWVDKGPLSKVQLADDLADVLVADGAAEVPRAEALRVLCPGGKALLGRSRVVKPAPKNVDDWTHPYHGPDNNPQSEDQVARAPYLTHFLAEPYYAPLPQVAVAAGGRVFKAFGNLAFHTREEHLLDTLAAFNGYNGTMLWRRRLSPGVMIHRNTMIATPDVLYVGDDKSCKRIDTATGRLIDEIIPPLEVSGGTFWKWMALENGVLYALVGEQEHKDPVMRRRREAHGWPWDPLSPGFNQPENPWGFGRNLLAIDTGSKRVKWSHREDHDIDSRALCMKNGRIYIYRHGEYLASLDARSGRTVWRKNPANAPELFRALGPALSRQDWRTNWRTTAYVKCGNKALYFAGPTIGKLLAVSVDDGQVLWEHPYDNFELVLRKDGLYGISGQIDKFPSMKFDPLTGKMLATLDTKRRACTRPTGTADAVFYRANDGSVRLDVASGRPQWVSPMRAQCQDGVTIANGLLYWWPSVCDCQNQIYGITCLGPAGNSFDFSRKAVESERLETGPGDIQNVAVFSESPGDWPKFRADNTGSASTEASISDRYTRLWWSTPEAAFTPTAPVTAGGLVFVGGSDGVVRALDVQSGKLRWKAYTGGFIRFPPTLWKGRVLVGSGDGWVYALETATGRLLWRFNAAPAQRKIPVYGSLMSTWPVSSGVAVDDGVAYFAAGIANYDGTHVYALNAETGRIVWQNNTSGHLDPQARTGVSVQGHLLIDGGKLYLAGGTSISPAVYNLSDGKCLNDPAPLATCNSTSVRGQELYKVGSRIAVSGAPLYGDPEYPVYDQTINSAVLHTSANGRDVVWVDNRKILCFKRLPVAVLDKSIVEGPGVTGWARFNISERPLWEYECPGSAAFARASNAVVYASSAPQAPPSLVAIDIKTGERFWKRGIELHAPPVRWGLAIDAGGRIIVTMKDGHVMCYGPAI